MDINNRSHTTSFSSVVIIILIMDYETLIKRVDQKSASILGTAVASVATLWYLKRAIQRTKEYKTGGSKDIPTPKGQYIYLGNKVLFIKRNRDD